MSTHLEALADYYTRFHLPLDESGGELPMLEAPEVKGDEWRAIIVAYRDGQRAWPLPGRDDVPAFMPWPIAWTLAEVAQKHDARAPRGYLQPTHLCVYTGHTLTMGGAVQGYRCARCSVPMLGTLPKALIGFDANTPDEEAVPSCVACRRPVLRLLEGAR